jgi:hypothetical protein
VAHPSLKPSQIYNLRLAASTMTAAARRAFQEEMTAKYCGGSARLAETILAGVDGVGIFMLRNHLR